MSTLLPILPPGDLLDHEDKLSPAAQQAEEEKNRMRRYFEKPEAQLNSFAPHEPVCLYLETTNRCNLLCTTCPRTYEQLEPEADMPWELFTSLIDQYPNIARVVLHGIGEPMLVKDLAQRVDLSQSPQHLRPLQHQWNPADQNQRTRSHRSRTR